jgi:hypothetical protein
MNVPRRFGRVCLPLLPLGLMIGAGFAPLRPEPPDQATYDKEIQPLLTKYCAGCHGKDRASAGVKVAETALAALQKDQENWRKIVRHVKDRSMPPQGMPQPSQTERDRLTGWLTLALDSAAARAAPTDPGRVLIHRLNRTEYNNTVRDLLGVTSEPANSFPADGGGGGGFDNNADTLFLPPVLMERYLDTADQVLAEAPAVRLFFVQPGKTLPARAAAKTLLARHATRAYRRPVADSDLARLLRIYDLARARKASHEDAVRAAMKAVLVSPRFLFRVERDTNQPGARTLDDYELASRLSYFLWSSMPDDTLFALAAKGRLRDPATLTAQVRRMLTDPRARALSDGFAGQWLHVRDLYTVANPDPGKFPTFTPSLRTAMYEETIRFFDSIVREDRSLMQLLDADYTFVNEELATHYGIPNVQGESFRRVALGGTHRGGILTQASVLTLTSYPQRTSPVLRGKWVLSELLGTPPPPPPPSVATLSQNDAVEEGLTFRQRLEKHRSKPECASCHARMDPIGFGLENFDPIGRFRTEIAGKPVDASGTLTDGQAFTGPEALKKQLQAPARRDDYIRNVTEKMLAYAIGRGIEPADLPTVQRITATLAKDDFKAQSLIVAIVKSLPFGWRRNDPATTVAHGTQP